MADRPAVRTCEGCSAPVVSRHPGTRFCSRACSNRSRPRPEVPDSKVCEGCGASFPRPASTTRGLRQASTWLAQRFCSRTCSIVAATAHRRPVKTAADYAGHRQVIPRRYGYLVPLVLERDDWTCRACGLRDPDIMVVDHIMPKALAPELVADTTNLQTLCPNDHARKTLTDRALIAEARRVG